MITVLKNAQIFDGIHEDLRAGHVVVEGEHIKEVTDTPPPKRSEHRIIELDGQTLMPGLIDAHIHAYFPEVNPTYGDRYPLSMVAHWARRMLEKSLLRGFTTVRDCGGGEQGLARAIEAGWVAGPRLIYCGKALSQTGGHGDTRAEGEVAGFGFYSHINQLVNGADAVRSAIREELRLGASFIKIMGSGGVASTTDSLENAQFSDDEIRAAVDETKRQGVYVTAHVHPDVAIRRCIDLGVRCLEHGTMISEETAQYAAQAGAAVVPTLSTTVTIARYGLEFGLTEASMAKSRLSEELAFASLEKLDRAGAKIGLGTDLIGSLEKYQCDEFTIRGEVMAPFSVLRSATSINADILGLSDEIGQIAPGYVADMIAISGNPLEDLSVFNSDGTNVNLVLKAGTVMKGGI